MKINWVQIGSRYLPIWKPSISISSHSSICLLQEGKNPKKSFISTNLRIFHMLKLKLLCTTLCALQKCTYNASIDTYSNHLEGKITKKLKETVLTATKNTFKTMASWQNCSTLISRYSKCRK